MPDLEIRNLHVRAGDKEILRGLELSVDKGEIHALMGPNGSGKSTLANAIMGHPNLEVTEAPGRETRSWDWGAGIYDLDNIDR